MCWRLGFNGTSGNLGMVSILVDLASITSNYLLDRIIHEIQDTFKIDRRVNLDTSFP